MPAMMQLLYSPGHSSFLKKVESTQLLGGIPMYNKNNIKLCEINTKA